MWSLSRSRVVLAAVSVVAVLAGVVLAVLKMLGLTGPALVLAGIVGVVAVAIPKLWEPIANVRGAARHERDRLAALARHARPVPISEVDPYAIGVFESQLAVDAAAPGMGPSPYVPRSIDEQLTTALQEATLQRNQRLVVVRGDPKAGKSRTLWQSVSGLSTRRLLALRDPFAGEGDPDAAQPLTALLALEQTLSTEQGKDLVVWIDDAQRHYQRGFTAENLRRLVTVYPRVIIAVTLHNSALKQIKAFDEPLEQLLRRASTGLVLEPVLSDDELMHARRLYPGIAGHDDLQRLPELLAGVNLLIERYCDNTASHPCGVAVSAAAIGWQRCGMPPGTITEPILRELTTHTLAQIAPQLDLADDEFTTGFAWARTTVAAQVALITRAGYGPDGSPRYQAFDAVVNWANRNQPQPVSEVWELAVSNADVPDLIGLGYAAHFQPLPRDDIARAAWEKAAGSRDPEIAPQAWFNLGLLLHEHRDFAGAGVAWQQAIDSRHPEQAPKAWFNLGVMLREQGDLAEARVAWQAAIESRHPEHSAKASFNLGLMLDQQGDYAGARSAYQQAIDSRHPEHAPRACFNLGHLAAEHGDLHGARAAWQEAVDSRHPEIAPTAGVTLALALYDLGDVVGAQATLQHVIESGHPELAPQASYNLGVLLSDQGNFGAARAAFQQAIDSDHPVASPKAADKLRSMGEA